MNDEPTEEEVEEFIELYVETGSMREVSEQVDYHYNTVRKHINRAKEDGDPRLADDDLDEQDGDESPWAGAGAGQSPYRDTESFALDPDLTGLSPGEFIKAFFEDFEVGIQNKFITIQARRADRRGALPTKESLMADILNMKSGIAQSSYKEANYIAQEYWAEAQRYINQTGIGMENEPISASYAGVQGAGMGQPNNQFAGQEGFVDPTEMGMGGPQQDPQMQFFQMMMNQMQQMTKRIEELAGGGQGRGSGQTTLDRLEDLKREQEILEEISGGDNRLEDLEQQIMALQQQILEGDQGRGAPQFSENETLDERLIKLASTDPDVTFSEIMDVIQDRRSVENDPEIIKLKKEMELREKEFEHESRKYDKLGNVLETGMERMGAQFGQAIVGGGQEAENEPTEPEQTSADGGTQPVAGSTAELTVQNESEECPNCGSQMHPGPDGTHCHECGLGFGQCDQCGAPVDIPPTGETEWGMCPQCGSGTKRAGVPDAPAECGECGWEGPSEQILGDALRCESCESIRPIARNPRQQSQQDLVMGD